MKEAYDIVIVGAASSGSYFARKIADAGYSVLVLDRLAEDKVGSKYDIFHILKPDFERFNLPFPEKGDDLAFEFTGGEAYSSFGKHPKTTNFTTVGMHMQKYTARLNRWAAAAGAEFQYGASFKRLTYENGVISGLEYEQGGETHLVGAKLVADCSGIPSVVRRTLPEGYGVENFEITPRDMFYVILRYVQYLKPEDYVKRQRSWTYFKTWEAPEADPTGAILGVGANISFDFAEGIYSEFEKAVELPPYQLKYKEQGTTPYRRPPYSFVADGFVAMGDTACLTKPHAGEGVTSSMVQIDIAADVVIGLLEKGSALTRENMWPVNKRYIEAQGKAFAGSLATLVGAVATSAAENDFFFEKDIIFSQKTFDSMEGGVAFSFGETVSMAFTMLGGVLSRRLRVQTVKALLRAMKNGDRVTAHYNAFPETLDGFEDWCKKADAIWDECGSMADHIQQAK